MSNRSKSQHAFNKQKLIAVIALFVIISAVFIINSHADTSVVAAEAESGAVAGQAAIFQDSTASGGGAVLFSGSSAAADFIYTPFEIAAGQSVEFVGRAACPASTCRYQWRWFRTDGTDRLGTTMGEGGAVSYIFGSAGTRNVVLKITSPGPTNNFITVSKVLTVGSAASLQQSDEHATG